MPTDATLAEIETRYQRECSVAGCANVKRALGWCRSHYSRFRRTGSVQAEKPLRRWTLSATERLWLNIEKDSDSDCWLWIGSLNENGYGRFYHEGAMRLAHRVAYEFARGPVSANLDLDHLCRVPRCVRPSHLEPVTHRENVLRGVGFAGINARKTHCPRGHEYDTTASWKGRTTRRCKRCHAANVRRWMQRKKAIEAYDAE